MFGSYCDMKLQKSGQGWLTSWTENSSSPQRLVPGRRTSNDSRPEVPRQFVTAARGERHRREGGVLFRAGSESARVGDHHVAHRVHPVPGVEHSEAGRGMHPAGTAKVDRIAGRLDIPEAHPAPEPRTFQYLKDLVACAFEHRLRLRRAPNTQAKAGPAVGRGTSLFEHHAVLPRPRHGPDDIEADPRQATKTAAEQALRTNCSSGPLNGGGGVQRSSPLERRARDVRRRMDGHTRVEIDYQFGHRVVVQVTAEHALGVAEPLRELVTL